MFEDLSLEEPRRITMIPDESDSDSDSEMESVEDDSTKARQGA